MSFFAIMGFCNSAVTLYQAIGRVFKADEKVRGLFDDALGLVETIEDLSLRSHVLFDDGAIDKMEFFAIVAKVEKVKAALKHLKNKVESKVKKIFHFASATGIVADSESGHSNLFPIETEM